VETFVNQDSAILASSCSTLLPSKISQSLKRREQFILAHPVSLKIKNNLKIKNQAIKNEKPNIN